MLAGRDHEHEHAYFIINHTMFFDWIFQKVSHDLAIDLGTANTLVAVKGRGIIIREPSLVVRQKKSHQILAVGNEAKKMLGKTPANLESVRPLHQGVIADFDAATAILTTWIKEVHNPGGILPQIPRPRVIVGIPSGITEVERRAVQEACKAAGARQVWLVEEPMAAAIGSGAPVEEPTGVLIVDIGGGTTEIAAISLSGSVVKKSIRHAGHAIDQAIIQYVRINRGLLIGEATAEQVKLKIGTADPDKAKKSSKKEAKTMVVRGRELESGLPASMVLEQSEVAEAMSPIIEEILVTVQDTIEEVPPELVADILERGIILAGGGALIPKLDQLIAQETKMPVWVAEDPLTCVVRGCLDLYDRPQLLEKVQMVSGLVS